MKATLDVPLIARLSRWLVTLLAAGLLASCGGGGGGDGSSSGYPGGPVSCSADNQKAWLRDYMNDQYFWYDKQGTPNEAATSLGAYFDSLLFKPIDRHSFAQNATTNRQVTVEGTFTGYGLSLAYEDAGLTILKVRLIEPLSPLGAAGAMRGDTIVSIDGLTPAQVTVGQLAGVSTAGVTRTFVLKNTAGVQRTLIVQSATFPLSPVIRANILTASNGNKVGYLMYQEFNTTGSAALGAAFDKFRNAGVTDLILDFRYNLGGTNVQARDLASMAGGNAVVGKVFANYRFNAKQTARNFTEIFNATKPPAVPLPSIKNVVVITSFDTASASELVINALRPFKNVITVGSTSRGKPYGFRTTPDICGLVYNAVNIEISNAVGFADYGAGFVPTCPVADDLTRQFGDPTEGRTAAALGYINTGSCPVAAKNLNINSAGSTENKAQTAIKDRALNTDQQSFGETGLPQMLIN
jgi:carboxyl-terminal processing protease